MEQWTVIETTEPYAQIKQVGRFTYSINIHWDGLKYAADWGAWGRGRAERKARRLLAWHLRRQQREREAWRVTTDG